MEKRRVQHRLASSCCAPSLAYQTCSASKDRATSKGARLQVGLGMGFGGWRACWVRLEILHYVPKNRLSLQVCFAVLEVQPGSLRIQASQLRGDVLGGASCGFGVWGAIEFEHFAWGL